MKNANRSDENCSMQHEVHIEELCDNCEDTVGYFTHERVEAEAFILAVARYCLALDQPVPPMLPSAVRYARLKYRDDAGEDSLAIMVPAVADDPDGFEMTSIRFDGEQN